MSKVVDMVRECVEPIIVNHGMELVDIEYKKDFTGSMALTIYIDKDQEGGVSLNDCEEIHRAIDEPLDNLDPTSGMPYNLNVSSPGLDRPFKRAKDYEKNIGKDVDISLYKTHETIKEKKFTAKLVAYDENSITIEFNNSIIKLNKEDVASVKQAIVF